MRLLRIARRGRSKAGHRLREQPGLGGAQAHRLAHVAQPAAAAHLRQRFGRHSERDGVRKLSVERVVGQVEVAGLKVHAGDLRYAAANARHGGLPSDGVAIA